MAKLNDTIINGTLTASNITGGGDKCTAKIELAGGNSTSLISLESLGEEENSYITIRSASSSGNGNITLGASTVNITGILKPIRQNCI